MTPPAKPRARTAKLAERWALYEESVQSPDGEVEFIDGIYRRRHGRTPRDLREDFCGSAALCRAWVEAGPERRALGLDLDPKALAYARRTHVARLGDRAPRLTLRRQNVLDRGRERSDVIVAYNFSYFVFKRRFELLRYFCAARAGLRRGGLFFLDLFGGITAQQPALETRELDGLTYIWEQASFEPLSSNLKAHIHFELPDGQMIHRAFSYDWRLWQPVELREVLEEAGFSAVDFYWEDQDAEGVRLGRFRRRTRVAPEPSWNAYVIAER